MPAVLKLFRRDPPPLAMSGRVTFGAMTSVAIINVANSNACDKKPVSEVAIGPVRKAVRRSARKLVTFSTPEGVTAWAEKATLKAISTPKRRPVPGPVATSLMRAGTARTLNRTHGMALYNWLLVRCGGRMLNSAEIQREYEAMLLDYGIEIRRPLSMLLAELSQLLGAGAKTTIRIVDGSGETRRRVYRIPSKRVPARFEPGGKAG